MLSSRVHSSFTKKNSKEQLKTKQQGEKAEDTSCSELDRDTSHLELEGDTLNHQPNSFRRKNTDGDCEVSDKTNSVNESYIKPTNLHGGKPVGSQDKSYVRNSP